MAAPSLLKKDFPFRFLLGFEVSVATRPIVWFAVILGLIFVIVYVFANRVPAVVGISEARGDNTTLGTLYEARGEAERSTATVWHNGSGGRDEPKVVIGNARPYWDGAIKPGSTGPGAVFPTTARPKQYGLYRGVFGVGIPQAKLTQDEVLTGVTRCVTRVTVETPFERLAIKPRVGSRSYECPIAVLGRLGKCIVSVVGATHFPQAKPHNRRVGFRYRD